MPEIKKGIFSLNLGLVAVKGEVSEDDRQCAWELYTELVTRVAVTGKQTDRTCRDFTGELYSESLASVYAFFQEARRIMRRFPVGRLDRGVQDHLGILINSVIRDVLRPFLEKWQAEYRFWWDHSSNPQLSPFERQKQFPRLEEFLTDWADLRRVMRSLQRRLVQVYRLVQVH